jgi:hypothetical protein
MNMHFESRAPDAPTTTHNRLCAPAKSSNGVRSFAASIESRLVLPDEASTKDESMVIPLSRSLRAVLRSDCSAWARATMAAADMHKVLRLSSNDIRPRSAAGTDLY